MFWGNPDASVNFCEDDYVKSNYIAEYNNTITCIFYLIPAFVLWNTKMKNISYCLISLAVGSAILHSTLRYYGQWMDEISMLILSFYTLINLNYPVYLYQLFVIIGIYLMLWNHFIVFFFMFTAMQILIALKSKKKSTKKINSIMTKLYLIFFILGTISWCFDKFLCSYVKDYNLHSWWHLFTSLAITFGYLGLIL
tara:strand:+ start:1915 stop:2502 length:588 start_codon:yes stop_codon:yes gene_type:complete